MSLEYQTPDLDVDEWIEKKPTYQSERETRSEPREKQFLGKHFEVCISSRPRVSQNHVNSWKAIIHQSDEKQPQQSPNNLNPDPYALVRELGYEVSMKIMFSSDPQAKARCLQYMYLIGMGEKAIRPILLDLSLQNVDFWQFALHCITRQNPIELTATTLAEDLCIAWNKWGRENGFL